MYLQVAYNQSTRNGSTLDWKKRFSGLMTQGKIAASTSVLSDQMSTGVLSPDSIIDVRTVESVLNDFHPMPSKINEDVLLSKRFHRAAYHHEVRFRAIDNECIIRACKKDKG
ncbi:hypothetical protein GJ496_005850 [Pomphorhynchus laevis]|nr:hypothetical protein GJ496_005850 [Pomphorhynchus laevis]